MFKVRKILHPTDFSSQAAVAFDVACSLAKQHDAVILILHVMPTPIVWGEYIPLDSVEEYEKQIREDYLLPIQSTVPGVRVSHLLEQGNPEEMIDLIAEEHECDLIVMGTHGRTGLGRLFMGSVAEKVIRGAPCPVLAVRVPPRETAHEAPETAGKAAEVAAVI